jgi:hypothetical protein
MTQHRRTPPPPMLLTVPGLFAAGISQANATLFMGACIALTAFPNRHRDQEGCQHARGGHRHRALRLGLEMIEPERQAGSRA